MTDKLNSFDAGAAYTVALGFLRAAEILNQENINGDSSVIPVVVNGVFACELLLKTLLSSESPESSIPHSHNLKQLFNRLCSESQLRIENSSGIINLSAFLDDASEAFKTWRYAFEQKYLSISINDILRFAESVKECI